MKREGVDSVPIPVESQESISSRYAAPLRITCSARACQKIVSRIVVRARQKAHQIIRPTAAPRAPRRRVVVMIAKPGAMSRSGRIQRRPRANPASDEPAVSAASKARRDAGRILRFVEVGESAELLVTLLDP